uniref:Cyclic nucleotide-binding domain-containing protein n=1 Tax=Palpitomonas bilix TaxID=652834 RepID=A0A7S3LXE6_9EUKA|mmetsp:Transcript_7728/g.20071  ORF Transcript_7728/g.20071 Transcript_7728/m.20071 type:complete len:477 (+) Transcript_7728:112-1542(+)
MSDSDESFSSVEREEGEGRVERKLSTFSDFSDGDDLDILEALKEAEKAAQRPVESKSGDEGTPPPPVLNTSDEEGSSPPVPRRAPPGFSLEVDADSEEEELDSPLPPPPALDSSLSSEGEEGGEAPPPLLSAGEKGKEGEAGVKHNQSGMESPCSAESDGEGGEVAKKEVEAAASVLDEIEPVLNSARSAANDAQPKMEGGAKASEKKEEAYAAASSSKPSSAIGSGEGAKLGGGRGGGGSTLNGSPPTLRRSHTATEISTREVWEKGYAEERAKTAGNMSGRGRGSNSVKARRSGGGGGGESVQMSEDEAGNSEKGQSEEQSTSLLRRRQRGGGGGGGRGEIAMPLSLASMSSASKLQTAPCRKVKKSVEVDSVGQGRIIGDREVVEKTPRIETAIADSTVDLLVISKWDFLSRFSSASLSSIRNDREIASIKDAKEARRLLTEGRRWKKYKQNLVAQIQAESRAGASSKFFSLR